MKMIERLIFTCAIMAMMTSLFGQNNSQLSIQGVLRNANGTAVENGQYDITFRLWNSPTNGTQIWMEEKSQVDVEGGVYSVILGDGATPLDASFTEQYYLGVSVEGGTELIPRAALTSSPYALSLIGSDNVFPNSGNVGVGADNPQNKLTVQRGDGILGLEVVEDANNTTTITTTEDGMAFDAGGTDKIYSFSNGRIDAIADEQLIIEGTDTAQLVFSKSSGNATFGFDAMNGDDLMLTNSVGGITLSPTNAPVGMNSNGETLQIIGTDSSFVSFYPQGISGGRKGYIGHKNSAAPKNMEIVNEAPNGNIHINTDDGKIYMNSYVNITGRDYQSVGSRYLRGTASNYTNYSTDDRYVGLRVTGDIVTNHLWVGSDRRIKKDFVLSNGLKDLEILNKIEVTDYRHIDGVRRGNEMTKGFIAQQVKSIFPEAIRLEKDYVPSIYTMASKVTSNDNHLIITLAKPHGLKTNDMVKIFVEEGEESTKVQSIKDEFSFAIYSEKIGVKEKVFVYGKEIDDFHRVEYDKVFTLNVSATQQLAREVEALKKENAQLKSKATQTNDLLKTLSAKVESLEQNLQMTGRK